MEIKDFPKLPSATSFIHKTLYDIAHRKMQNAQMQKIKNG
jgi:hypothetical protein